MSFDDIVCIVKGAKTINEDENNDNDTNDIEPVKVSLKDAKSALLTVRNFMEQCHDFDQTKINFLNTLHDTLDTLNLKSLKQTKINEFLISH